MINKNLIDAAAPYKSKTIRYTYSYINQLEAPLEAIITTGRKQCTKKELKN